MIKSDIVKALQRSCHAEFITRQQIAKAFGIKNSRYVQSYVDGLDKIDGKYYLIEEVADNILRRTQ